MVDFVRPRFEKPEFSEFVETYFPQVALQLSANVEADSAVRAERERCMQLLGMFREEFRGAKLEHAWCRAYNLIASGSLPPKMHPEIDPEASPRNP